MPELSAGSAQLQRRRPALRSWSLLAMLALLLSCAGAVHAQSFRFNVMMHVMRESADESDLRAALATAQTDDPAFIVVNGIRAPSEPCTDRLFRQRIALLEQAGVPVILSLAGSDWQGCRDRQGRPAAQAWLNLLREQAYGDISWSGGKHLSLRRQSAIPAFRAYAENTRWVLDQVLFATLNLPSNNNNFIASAGGNSEFEDRQIANRDWLKRLALQARSERRSLIVLFCDGHPLPGNARKSEQRDGYAEVRQQLRALAEKSGARVLVVQGPAPVAANQAPEIRWEGRLGHVSLEAGVSSVSVDLSAAVPVTLTASEP